MTGRQRIINAIERKPIDRTPIDFGSHFSTGISVFAYHNLRKYLGLSTDAIELADTFQCLARVDEDVLDRFHVDTILLWPGKKPFKRFTFKDGYTFDIPSSFNPERHENGEVTAVEEGGVFIKMPAGGYFFDAVPSPTPDTGSTPAPAPDPDLEPFKRGVDLMVPEARRIYHETDKYTMFMQLGACFPHDWDDLCGLYTDPGPVVEKLAVYTKYNLECAEYVIQKLGETIQCIAINSDMGTQSAPVCGPDIYEKYILPNVKKLCSFIHNNSDCKIFLHSCGAIEPLIPYIIEAGVDILNPVQISCENMAPNNLKQKYGGKITFWGGGCDTQRVLNFGTPKQVAENVRELMGIFASGGGFVFNQVHNVMGDIKPENIVAMLDTAYKESFKYGSGG